MLRKLLASVACILLVSGAAFAQGTITGTVTDSRTGETEFSIDLPSVQLGLISAEEQSMSGGNNIAPTASVAAFQRALLREYSVELEMIAGIGTHWAFMRRHDLLQEGTPVHYPIPGAELEITQSEYYTFGGAGNEGEEGTATGDNSWRKLDASKLGLSGNAGDGQNLFGPRTSVGKNVVIPTASGGGHKGRN